MIVSLIFIALCDLMAFLKDSDRLSSRRRSIADAATIVLLLCDMLYDSCFPIHTFTHIFPEGEHTCSVSAARVAVVASRRNIKGKHVLPAFSLWRISFFCLFLNIRIKMTLEKSGDGRGF